LVAYYQSEQYILDYPGWKTNRSRYKININQATNNEMRWGDAFVLT